MTPTAWTIARAMAAASRPPVAVSQKPMPDQPAGRGDPAQLVVGEVAPVVGRRADAGVRRDDGARGHAHARRRSWRPTRGPRPGSGCAPPSRGRARGRAASARPCRCRAPTRRTPCRRSARARSCGSPPRPSRRASTRSGPSACAPSIARTPAVRRGSAALASRYAARSSRVPMSRNAPSDRAASRCARSARNRARAGRLRQVRGGQRAATATLVTSSLRSSLRSMLRWRGDLTAAENTWSATPPSIMRGTSRWPRVPRTSRSRPNSSESACRSTARIVAWRASARSEGRGGGAVIAFRRRSTRPIRWSSTGPAAARPATAAAPPATATRRRELTRRTPGRGSAGSRAGCCRWSASPRRSSASRGSTRRTWRGRRRSRSRAAWTRRSAPRPRR